MNMIGETTTGIGRRVLDLWSVMGTAAAARWTSDDGPFAARIGVARYAELVAG